MSVRRRIVSYQEMGPAFQPYLQQVGESAGLEGADEVNPSPTEFAAITSGLQELEKAGQNPNVMMGTEHETASLLQTFLAQQATQVAEAAAEGLEAKFDDHDLLGWIGSFFTWWRRIQPHPWVEAAATPTSIPNSCRLALFGDWGTGMYGAPVLSKTIAADAKKFDVVLHLGDTYYSGDDNEIKERLVAIWPNVAGALNRTLNGNHEMYTGGHAYFDVALNHFGQPASYFALQNDHWLLAGLDSAYADHDLAGNQVAWLDKLVAQAGDRKLVLFSHHQPYSLLDSQGPKLIDKLARYLNEKKIYAWYWGHEHHCVLYDPHPAWGLRGRCIGHGGFPYFREKVFGDTAPSKPTWFRLDTKNLVPGAYVLDGTNEFITGHEKEYGPHGYLTLEFDGKNLHETVVDPTGRKLDAPGLIA